MKVFSQEFAGYCLLSGGLAVLWAVGIARFIEAVYC